MRAIGKLKGWGYAVTGRLLAVCFGFAALACDVSACAVGWQLPRDHFNGVNEYGFVSYWEQIGELDLKDGFKMPLVIGFESNRETASPYLGRGWIFPLLESRIVQTSERDFQMILPDGYTQSFWREKTPDVLTGQTGWKAQIKGDTITAYADCGWKLTFTKGRLSAIGTPKNKNYEFVLNGNKVSEIRESGVVVLRVDTDAATGEVSGFSCGGQRIRLALDGRPEVQSVKGQNLVSGVQSSLKSVTLPNGDQKIYEFAVNTKIQPTLTISGKSPRVFTWDPTTKRILKDGEWTYRIEPKDSGQNAAISRTDAKERQEHWFHQGEKGIETTVSIENMKTVKTWFTSGVLAGRTRDYTHSLDGVITQYSYSYDEKGRLIRSDVSKVVNGIKNIVRRSMFSDKGSEIKVPGDSQISFLPEVSGKQGAIEVMRVVRDSETIQKYIYDPNTHQTRIE